MNKEECYFSSDLLPNEYEQKDNKTSLVHVFLSKNIKCDQFVERFKSMGYDISERNIHTFINRNLVLDALKTIRDETKGKSSLIILFWGQFRRDKKFLLDDGSAIKLVDIWSTFVTKNCPELIGKPKVFLFNGVRHLNNQEDTTSLRPGCDKYNLPSEADILIVFKQNEDKKKSEEYMNTLSFNMVNYGHQYDLFALVAIAFFSEQPTLISTMTKKFYLMPGKTRDCEESIEKNMSKINENLKKFLGLMPIMANVSVANVNKLKASNSVDDILSDPQLEFVKKERRATLPKVTLNGYVPKKRPSIEVAKIQPR